ncbi:ras-related protein Rab-15 isoform X2 [Strix uralensis]|uniref:ras-related protein Rab-15 isoform X2 n=1 Tax=Strix uralensis TaxID=36305 RepID=UPI003DA6354D
MGIPWAPGNGKTVDTEEPGVLGSRSTGKPWEPGSRGHPKTGRPWAPGALGSRSTGKTGEPGSCSTGEQGNRAAVGMGKREDRVDFKMKTIEVDGIKVRIQIWDTAGQERYQTITKQYYRRAQGIFLVYDISSERSYQHIVKWASDVDEYAPDGVQKILIGNKADEEHKRQVAKEQGLQGPQQPSCSPACIQGSPRHPKHPQDAPPQEWPGPPHPPAVSCEARDP